MERLVIERALLSVTHKDGLEEFGRFLSNAGVELISTGGTHKMLSTAGLKVAQVSEVTGFPEILGGRVKTLHPNIHAGLLADKDDPGHMETLARLGLATIDLVVVNLYDFARALEQGLDIPETIEQIDIGGPTLLRAAAKNCRSVLVAPEPSCYPRIMDEMRANGMAVGQGLRYAMGARTFALVSAYDAMIAKWFKEKVVG